MNEGVPLCTLFPILTLLDPPLPFSPPPPRCPPPSLPPPSLAPGLIVAWNTRCYMIIRSFLPPNCSPQNPPESPRKNMSRVHYPSHTFKKSPKPLSPVPPIQVNYNTTSKTSLRHPSIQVRSVPRHMIKRYVRITSDPKSRPNQSPKCSSFKQIRVQPLRHHQDSSIYKLEVRQDRYKGDMSRLDKICQDPLRIQKVAQTRPPRVVPSRNL